MTELEQLKKENEELKEILKEDVKQSHSQVEHIRMMFRICIISNMLWFSLFLITLLCAFAYYYNTEEVLETITTQVTQEGIINKHDIKSTNSNVEFITSDILLKENYGKTNN